MFVRASVDACLEANQDKDGATIAAIDAIIATAISVLTSAYSH